MEHAFNRRGYQLRAFKKELKYELPILRNSKIQDIAVSFRGRTSPCPVAISSPLPFMPRAVSCRHVSRTAPTANSAHQDERRSLADGAIQEQKEGRAPGLNNLYSLASSPPQKSIMEQRKSTPYGVLLIYTVTNSMVGTGRFELPTPRTPSECSTRLSHVPTQYSRPGTSQRGVTPSVYTSLRLCGALWNGFVYYRDGGTYSAGSAAPSPKKNSCICSTRKLCACGVHGCSRYSFRSIF